MSGVKCIRFCVPLMAHMPIGAASNTEVVGPVVVDVLVSRAPGRLRSGREMHLFLRVRRVGASLPHPWLWAAATPASSGLCLLSKAAAECIGFCVLGDPCWAGAR